MSEILNKRTRDTLKAKAKARKAKNGIKRRTTTPTALPKTVTAILLRNGGRDYDPSNDPEAPMHLRHGDAPEWSYRAEPGAVPTYDKNYHPFTAVQLLAEGASVMELALEFGIYPTTIYKWMRAHEEFALAVNHGRVLTKAWWLREGRKNLSNARFNNALYALHMSNRFGWAKKAEHVLNNPQALTSPDEILPPELREQLLGDGNEIEVEAVPESDDVSRSAEILDILYQAGALPNPDAPPAEDDDEQA
jgi:hypothetical protein